jgi:pilus assembly protein CpaE
MKVRVLSNDAGRLQAIHNAICSPAGLDEISGTVAAPAQIAAAVDGQRFDLLIVDNADCASLEALEQLSKRRPEMSAIVVSDDQSTDFLKQAMRSGVREVLPLGSAPQALQAAYARVRQMREHVPGHGEGQLLAFMPCKGGSGATFLATNVAYALAEGRQRRIALIDLNLQFGDAALYVSDSRAPSNVAEVAQQIERLDGSLLESSMLQVLPNLSVLAAPGDPALAAEVDRRHIEAILKVARSRFDLVVIDLPRSLDAITLCALDLAQTILPVLQLVLPHFRDARRLVDTFRSLDYPRSKARFVVNRFEKGGQVTLDDLETAIGQKAFMTVPNDYSAVTAAVNLGIPLVRSQRNHPISRALVRMARELDPVTEESAPAGAGWLGRIFGGRQAGSSAHS